MKLLQSESHILSGIYPRILPLCHKIPKVHLKPFYTDFLDALRNGLNTYVPKSSRHQNTQFQNQQNGALNCVQAFFEVSIFGLKNDDDQLVHDLIGNKVREDFNSFFSFVSFFVGLYHNFHQFFFWFVLSSFWLKCRHFLYWKLSLSSLLHYSFW